MHARLVCRRVDAFNCVLQVCSRCQPNLRHVGCVPSGRQETSQGSALRRFATSCAPQLVGWEARTGLRSHRQTFPPDHSPPKKTPPSFVLSSSAPGPEPISWGAASLTDLGPNHPTWAKTTFGSLPTCESTSGCPLVPVGTALFITSSQVVIAVARPL